MEAKHIILVAQGLCGITACIQLLGWCVYYRGGIAFISSNKDRISNVHAVFTFVGLIFIPSEAILAYKLLPLRHRVRKSVHLTALLIAMVLGAIGINAAFTFQRQSGILEILYSLHSWLGAGTIFLFIFQWLVGLLCFLYPRLSKSSRSSFLPWHRNFGVFIYMMMILTAVTGFTEKLTLFEAEGLARFSLEAILVNITALVVILFGTLVVLSVMLP
ncbi:hypothetical protein SUGI_1034550 [Cryptomeria japonica]|uniref:probable ascorbate-specific transmembrane electron transporter 1 isoform X1 n=1 Tax=Cryptomeria japonica TaxID=3369 RepID=UPI00241468B4|nr:probable ascorbate-specific transmembrane electron transporter 1 isoform X1 [Cryptomeria japonica]GLJ49040.1 hypothetical protein SUGI_1034550 [Cryptomeria japonica]